MRSMVSNSPRKSESSRRAKPSASRQTRNGKASTSRERQRRVPASQRRSITPRPDTRADRKKAREASKLSTVKREAREKRQKAHRLKKWGIALLLVALVVGLGVGAYELIHSSLFDITTIEVSGTKLLTKDDVIHMLNFDTASGQSLILLDKRDVIDSISKSSWIAGVSVKKRLPHVLSISVEERKPVMKVRYAGDDSWVVGTGGYWLGIIDTKTNTIDPGNNAPKVTWKGERLIEVVDMPSGKPKVGTRIKTAELRNAFSIVTGLSDKLRSQIVKISTPDVSKTMLSTEKGIEIAIGSANDIVRKDKIARTIMREEKGKVVLINVRSVAAPTWRGLNE